MTKDCIFIPVIFIITVFGSRKVFLLQNTFTLIVVYCLQIESSHSKQWLWVVQYSKIDGGLFFRTQSSLIWLGWSNPIGICLLENWLRFLHWLGEDRPCTEMTFQPVRRMLAPLINARHLEEELCSRDTLLQLDFWISCWVCNISEKSSDSVNCQSAKSQI